MKMYQQSCSITLSTGAMALMAGIFTGRPFVTPEMLKGRVKYWNIVWHAPREVVCKARYKRRRK